MKYLIQVMFGQKTEIFQGKECTLYDTAVAYTGQHAFLKSHIQHQKGVLIQAVDLMGFTALVTLFIPVADNLGEQNALQEERLIFTWFQRASGACDSTSSPYGASREIETVKSAPKGSPPSVTYFF